MTRRETAAEIDDAAARWAVRLEAGSIDADEEAELDAWLAGDVRRVGAFAKARAVALETGRAAALKGFDADQFAAKPAPTLSRRMLVGAGATALAASVAGGLWFWNENNGGRFRTRLGEVRVVSLEDGSVVTLNTSTEIAVRFSEAARHVVLVAGEALFDVARDAERPFIVNAGAMVVRAIGTSFSVRRFGAAPEVLVREGVVEVSRSAQDRPVRLGAERRALALANAPIEPIAVPSAEISRSLAWRDGRLAFEGETLREAAAQFARYSETRIVFEDASIADEPVTGLFVSTDPVGFARAVASAFDLEAEARGGEVRLRRRAS